MLRSELFLLLLGDLTDVSVEITLIQYLIVLQNGEIL